MNAKAAFRSQTPPDREESEEEIVDLDVRLNVPVEKKPHDAGAAEPGGPHHAGAVRRHDLIKQFRSDIDERRLRQLQRDA
jgi:hypothetical protein